MSSLAALIPAAVGILVSVAAYFRGKRYEQQRDQAAGGSTEFRRAVSRMDESVALCIAGAPTGIVVSVFAYFAIQSLE